MVLILDPLNPNAPADDQDNALPNSSVIVTIVLLNVERICATPFSIFFSLYVYEILVYVPLFLPPLPIIFLISYCFNRAFTSTCVVLVFDHELVSHDGDEYHGMMKFPLNV